MQNIKIYKTIKITEKTGAKRLKMGRRVENVDNVEKMQKIEKNQKKQLTFS